MVYVIGRDGDGEHPCPFLISLFLTTGCVASSGFFRCFPSVLSLFRGFKLHEGVKLWQMPFLHILGYRVSFSYTLINCVNLFLYVGVPIHPKNNCSYPLHCD